MVTFFVRANSPEVIVIVCGVEKFPAVSNVIVAPSHASRIACRKDPAPLSAVLVTVTGDKHTARFAVLLVVPVPPLVELTASVVFVTFTCCVGVTFTTTLHVFPGVAILPPVRLMLVLFAAAVTAPPQLFVTPGVLATCNPLVSVSLKAIPFSAEVLAAGFVIVNVKVVVPFGGRLLTPNALLMVGAATTFRVAVLLVAPVPPSAEVIAPV